jgi:hypothetical protein
MTGEVRDDYYVAAGRFASPTGFVNYDLPTRFDFPVDAGRHEPMPNESKSEEAKDRKKPSIPKRLAIGAVAVGGLSYSLAVVDEYFKKGGSNGNSQRRL